MMLAFQITLVVILILSFILSSAEGTKEYKDRMTAVVLACIIALTVTLVVPIFQ